MAKYAFLFPGQGAQAPGMMKDICEAVPESRKVLDDISAIWGKDVAKLMWETEADELSRSDNSQMAITAASIAVVKALEIKGIKPSAAMGFSLGEFPALYAAGVLSFEDVIKVVAKRGSIMQAVCEQIAAENSGHAPGMSAVIGLSPEQVKEIASKCENVYAANMNSPVQTVLSGTFDGLTQAEALAKEAGARRALRLAVAGPFHCPLMQRAADEFEKAIADVKFNNPEIALFSNVTGKRAENGEEIKKNAVLHLTHPVLWTDEEKVLFDMMEADGGEWKLFEPGPGKVLTGLWAKSGLEEKYSASAINSVENLNSL
ncbi:MAG: ACP S-malonyltransferase [Spirochaetia bacterium]|nr:ACP S-malonyltransferase [Spirochaetia bacterium]MDD7699493.1 ACP S-malonyltransferase [Spirochaetia bacterium]MDY4210746.1 ACP S-malonyltransferase [Treponema sp.]